MPIEKIVKHPSEREIANAEHQRLRRDIKYSVKKVKNFVALEGVILISTMLAIIMIFVL